MQAERPGCLVATFVYQDRQFDARVRDILTEVTEIWRARFRARIAAIAAVHPPRIGVDLDVLADMLLTIVDGSIVIAKALASRACWKTSSSPTAPWCARCPWGLGGVSVSSPFALANGEGDREAVEGLVRARSCG